MSPLDSPGPIAKHLAALNEGRFVVQRSLSTGKYCYPPRVTSPGDNTDDLEWREVSGYGEVYALTIIARKPERGGDYNIAIVELEEGPRMMSRIVNAAPNSLRIGMKVRAQIEIPTFGTGRDANQAVVLFEPVAS